MFASNHGKKTHNIKWTFLLILGVYSPVVISLFLLLRNKSSRSFQFTNLKLCAHETTPPSPPLLLAATIPLSVSKTWTSVCMDLI